VKEIRRTKIVATLGPASSTPEKIVDLIKAGVNVFRLNFSHGERETHKRNVVQIRKEGKRLGIPIAVLQDLQGPKIRVGVFEKGQTSLEKGEAFNLTCDDDSPGNHNRVGVTYKSLFSEVNIGDSLLLDDGRLSVEITGVEDQTILTKVTLGGTLSNNKGINIPGVDLSIPAVTEKDVQDLLLGAELDVDWVAISFVRSRDDILLARHHLDKAGSQAKLMAKIEKPAGLSRFAEILQEVDGVMVARGDLGVEMPPEQVPLIQKQLIQDCSEAGKPVITATQMLESMINNPTPTRAEASDVANAIYDGTDAVMLSAETAVGAYPIEAVKIMDRIARSVETDARYRQAVRDHLPKSRDTTADAVSLGAVEMACNLQADLIVTFTTSGTTAQQVSRYRPTAPVLAITPSVRAFRQMSVSWGLTPFLSKEIYTTDEMVEKALQAIKNTGIAEPGGRFVITAGVPFGMSGTTNLIRVDLIPK
jgi:pyruvate kinase